MPDLYKRLTHYASTVEDHQLRQTVAEARSRLLELERAVNEISDRFGNLVSMVQEAKDKIK